MAEHDGKSHRLLVVDTFSANFTGKENTGDVACFIHVEVIDVLANRVEGAVGVAFFVACHSALRRCPLARHFRCWAT